MYTSKKYPCWLYIHILPSHKRGVYQGSYQLCYLLQYTNELPSKWATSCILVSREPTTRQLVFSPTMMCRQWEAGKAARARTAWREWSRTDHRIWEQGSANEQGIWTHTETGYWKCAASGAPDTERNSEGKDRQQHSPRIRSSLYHWPFPKGIRFTRSLLAFFRLSRHFRLGTL